MGLRRRVAGVAVTAARVAVLALPERTRKRLEDRVFYAIFNVTRIENDNYGYRPDPESGGSGLDEAARPLRRG